MVGALVMLTDWFPQLMIQNFLNIFRQYTVYICFSTVCYILPGSTLSGKLHNEQIAHIWSAASCVKR